MKRNVYSGPAWCDLLKCNAKKNKSGRAPLKSSVMNEDGIHQLRQMTFLALLFPSYSRCSRFYFCPVRHVQKQLSENVFIDERRPVLLCDGKLCLRALLELFNLTIVEMMHGTLRVLQGFVVFFFAFSHLCPTGCTIALATITLARIVPPLVVHEL